MTDNIGASLDLTFKKIEREFYAEACKFALEIIEKYLEELDGKLFAWRDRKIYRGKGIRLTTVKTIYGKVKYYRHVYEVVTPDGRKKYVYLLDEILNIKGTGRFLSGTVDKILKRSDRKVLQKIGRHNQYADRADEN